MLKEPGKSILCTSKISHLKCWEPSGFFYKHYVQQVKQYTDQINLLDTNLKSWAGQKSKTFWAHIFGEAVQF